MSLGVMALCLSGCVSKSLDCVLWLIVEKLEEEQFSMENRMIADLKGRSLIS